MAGVSFSRSFRTLSGSELGLSDQLAFKDMKGASISAATPFSHTKRKQTARQAQRAGESRALENTAAMQSQSSETQRERTPMSISFSHLNIFSQHGLKAPESEIIQALEVQPLNCCTSTTTAAKIVAKAVTPWLMLQPRSHAHKLTRIFQHTLSHT
ncbi:hypothetical protein Baya_2061 [Bagarius yarrelli]|uniref:Uncharacterized protein n=1 Tax=Bagarius yarrelli TaxID=175774 RepID=A0A556TMW2_BAGYA|nr:hypothetical protein Baya_2061 [Bagarius yarrelli]